MKRNIIQLAFMIVFAMLVTYCGKTYMEENQDKYKASDVIPIVIKAEGPSLVLQTKSYPFKITYDRAGSRWNWTAVNATVKSVSADTKTATVEFNVLPSNDTALVKVTETTVGGVTSPEKVFKVKVKPYCPLQNGMNTLVGTWSGPDGQGDYTYTSTVTVTALSGDTIVLDGLGAGFMEGFWEEPITSGGTCKMVVKDDGTVSIPLQYYCDTEYSNGYKIKGSGTWDNCGTKPKIVINYDIWWPDKDRWIAAYYKSLLGNKDYLEATLTMN